MSEIRVCFLGTPDFATVCLKRLLEDDHYKVVGVVTQPDRPSGRKLQLTPSSVKTLALQQGLPVLTPESLRREPEAVEIIKSWKAEIAVVVAFGQILDQNFLSLFPYGCVNVHASLLPRWRGAAPIQRSIEAGDTKTGVCLQKMVLKLDAGDVIGSREVALDDQINSLELHDRLAVLGADLLHIEMMDYIRGYLAGMPQDESLVTYAKKIEKTESELNFQESASSLHNRVRAFVWGPGTYALFLGKRLKIHKTSVIASSVAHATPGDIVEVQKDSFRVQTGEGLLEILEVQPESKSRMAAADFIKGFQIQKGMRLGN
ncbi:MAG: methionyl-tRNA formyltransferase [Bdellovibrionales bacterium]